MAKVANYSRSLSRMIIILLEFSWLPNKSPILSGFTTERNSSVPYFMLVVPFALYVSLHLFGFLFCVSLLVEESSFPAHYFKYSPDDTLACLTKSYMVLITAVESSFPACKNKQVFVNKVILALLKLGILVLKVESSFPTHIPNSTVSRMDSSILPSLSHPILVLLCIPTIFSLNMSIPMSLVIPCFAIKPSVHRTGR